MNNQRRIILFILATLIIAGGLIYWRQSQTPVASEPRGDKPVVATTIFPLYSIASAIAGDAVDVELVLPPGASPHTFDVSPSVLLKVQDAEVIYAIGHGLDNWALDVVGSADQVVTVDRGIELREFEEEDHEELEDEHGHEEDHHEDEDEDGHEEDEHGHEGVDPHYWLDATNGIKIGTTITDDLQRRFPEFASIFESNFATLRRDIVHADAEIKTKISPLIENKNIITFHDAWYYFANAYDLNVAGTYEPSAGREPTPRALAELSATVRQANTRAIYSEPQFGTGGLDAFAKDNGLSIVILDPLGGTAPRESYVDLLLENARRIAENQ